MAIASGLTSAITNPVAEGVRHAVMASDVLMGNDQDAARWIKQFRSGPADGELGGRRTNRRRGGAGPATPAEIPGVTVFSADVPGVDVPGLDVPATDAGLVDASPVDVASRD
jgi:5-methyltetrahydrofolate--homocysteine methyltransferase